MDKLWIEQKLDAYFGNHNFGLHEYNGSGREIRAIERCAELIATQHEADVAHLKAMQLCGHPVACVKGADEGTQSCEMCLLEGRIEKLLAQVAVMSTVLQEAKDVVGRQRKATPGIYIRISEALSAAPRVVWHFTWQPADDGYWGVFVKDILGERDWREGSVTPGQEIQVIVLECLRRPEQPQSSEQPRLVDSFAELSQLIGKSVEDIDEVEAWVRELRGNEQEE